MVVSDDPKSAPAPETAASWPEFTERLRELHTWCGKPKYATLSKASGLAPSAISNLIGRNPLSRPPEAATLRLVEACLIYQGATAKAVQEQSRRWQSALRTLAAADGGTAAGAEDGPVPVAEDGGGAVLVPGEPGRRSWLFVVATVVVVTGIGAAAWAMSRSTLAPDPGARPTIGSPSAAASCLRKDTSIKDERTGQTWRGLFECENIPGSEVFEWARSGEVVGRLESNPSWFVCWMRGERHSGGNDIWYYTQGDYSAGKKHLEAWGFVPADKVRTISDPDPAVTRRCEFG
ncbi:hypothetical protein [Sphaerisporangium aureirubrum]|uniref:XRE family transcriptional regulator n=1 Tax=Sphaerisporangium aureirubrum TaxID=1544736 RepID=A0ABW1NJC8_9ACTN